MATTLFVDEEGSIDSSWLNDVNTNTYSAANKAALVLLTPALGLKVFVSSSDGGMHKAVVGAAPGTYVDSDPTYCGVTSIPTGGDGSIAWVRDYSGAINAAWFGLGESASDAVNSAAVQSVLDILSVALIGGRLYIPQGNYSYSPAVTYQQTGLTLINPGVEIFGDGRRTSILTYTGTSGFGINIKGATSSAVASTGRLGLVEGITIKSIGLKGTGVLSGNTDSGVYIQGFNHVLFDDFLVNDFPQDGIHLDRLYYALSPDATLDDRGSFAHLKDGEISECGRTGLQAGGLNSATDYSADHLYTENLHITANDGTGAKIYTQNWTDAGSLFYADVISLHLYAQNTSILTQSVTMIGSRFEGGQSDCMLKIDSCLSGHFINVFFTGHAGPLPLTQIKIATDATYNVGYLTFESCMHQTATTAYEVTGTGGVTGVRIVNPRFASVTTEVSNSASKPVQLIKGNGYERLTGGSQPIKFTGIAGTLLTAQTDGDAAEWYKLDGSGKKIFMGNGAGTADISHTLSAATPEGAITANPGSIHFNTAGGAGTSFYVKESGTGNTGWVGK